MLGPILETLIGGLMTGVLYSLVALGFVLIFKASGVFNFAQGAMVLFAALSFARLSEFMPLVIAFALSVLIMIALAYAIEFLVLRHLVEIDPFSTASASQAAVDRLLDLMTLGRDQPKSAEKPARRSAIRS